MNKLSLNLFLFVFVSLFISVYLVRSFGISEVRAAATHLVISEVQLAGTTAGDEFIELYNPTNSSIDLTGWRLTRKTSTGTQGNLVASMSGTISSQGYFLVAPAVDYVGSTTPDLNYSTATRVAADNTILIYSDDGVTLVDRIGFEDAIDFENVVFPNNPTAGSSVERKTNSASDSVSMGPGGSDEFGGNGEDTDNNATDFTNRTVSQPQNSASAIESITGSPAPSSSPSVVPTPSVEPSQSPSPLASPSVTPSPSPSTTPSPSVIPSGTPVSKVIGFFPFAKNPKVCTITYQPKTIASISFLFPKLSCHSI